MPTAKTKSGRRRPDPCANWPPGWKAEADRLAEFYLLCLKGIDDYKRDLTAAEDLRRLARVADDAAGAFKAALAQDGADLLVRVFYYPRERIVLRTRAAHLA